MIELKNIRKTFNKQTVIKELSLSFPNRGLIAICGPSGCGKTTLLNIIAGLLKPDSGTITFDTVEITGLSDYRMSSYRLRHFGFIFQDFKLFESETVENNISLPLESISHVSSRLKERKVDDLLKIVGLKSKRKQNVNKLSGGEKQRIAIARAIINNPDVIFADEPTGSLDEKNAIQVMDILRILSTKALVIIVSHDEELIKRYSNKIIHMKDGEVEEVENISSPGEKQNLQIVIEKKKIRRISIPFPFLLRHSYKKMKEKKWRTMMCDFVMSLSLIGVGASISLTSSISTNIKKAYGETIGDDRILINKRRETNNKYGIYSASFEEVEEISSHYPEEIIDIGICYYNDFNHFFEGSDAFAFIGNGKEFYSDGLSSRDVNEYVWFENMDNESIFPKPVDSISRDEVVLGLTIEMVREICLGLKIERTVNSLSYYLEDNDLLTKLYVDNPNWNYSFTATFKVVGFILEKNPRIYHFQHNWNEYVFEKLLKLPPTNYISGFSKYPWDLKKIYYLKTSRPPEYFLGKAFDEIEYSKYVFEIADKTYYPNLYLNKEFEEFDRILIFYDYRSGINTHVSPYIVNAIEELSNPIYASYGGYIVYPSSFMSGFAKPTYFSSDIKRMEDAIDILSSFSDDVSKISSLPDGVISGYFANTSDNVFYVPIDNVSLNLNEVIISRGLAKKLFKDEEIINKKIYVSFNNKEINIGGDKIKREFVQTELIVKGITNEDKEIIHQSSKWGILFFQCKLGISIFSLSVYSISYSLSNKNNIDNVIKKGNTLFSDLEFYNPLEEFNLGVDEVCGYIEIALLIFSIISIIVSILLLSTCTYLHVLENRKDIGLARCLGIPKNEASKFIYTYSFLSTFISFALSSIELLGFTFFSMFTISKFLGSSAVFTFNPLSIVAMFLLSTIIATFSSTIFVRKITKLNPIESLK